MHIYAATDDLATMLSLIGHSNWPYTFYTRDVFCLMKQAKKFLQET